MWASAEREVHATEQRTGVHPGLRAVGIAGGRLRFVERLAELADFPGQREPTAVGGIGSGTRDDAAVERAHRAGHHLQRRLDLGAVGVRRPELGRRDDRRQDRADVAVGSPERRGGALDQGRGRIVAHEAAGELGRDEARGRLVPHQDVDHALAILLAAARRDHLPEHALGCRDRVRAGGR